MHIPKQKQTHRYKEQKSGYQRGERNWDRQDRGMGLRDTSYYV